MERAPGWARGGLHHLRLMVYAGPALVPAWRQRAPQLQASGVHGCLEPLRACWWLCCLVAQPPPPGTLHPQSLYSSSSQPGAEPTKYPCPILPTAPSPILGSGTQRGARIWGKESKWEGRGVGGEEGRRGGGFSAMSSGRGGPRLDHSFISSSRCRPDTPKIRLLTDEMRQKGVKGRVLHRGVPRTE